MMNHSICGANCTECKLGEERCFGIVTCMDFLLVCTYGENGAEPELALYKKR